MNPRKPKRIYQEVAEELNIDKDLVEDLVEFYYKDVRSLLSNLEYPRINIESLGHFVSKPKMVYGSIEKISRILKEHDTSTFKAYHNKKALENKLELLLKLNLKIQDQTEKREAFFKNKNK